MRRMPDRPVLHLPGADTDVRPSLRYVNFNGNINKRKMLGWLALANAYTLGLPGLTVEALASYAGNSRDAMIHLLRKWVKWGHVTKSAAQPPLYQLAPQGHVWLGCHFWKCPFPEWYSEMNPQQREFYAPNLEQWRHLQGLMRGAR